MGSELLTADLGICSSFEHL